VANKEELPVRRIFAISIAVLLIGYLVVTSMFQVEETETAVVTQFGNPLRVIDEPGLVFKLPDPIQSVIRMDNRLQALDSIETEYLTRDKKNLVISSFVLWRIADPRRFLQSVRDKRKASLRLSDVVASELGVAIGTYDLSDFLNEQGGDTAIPELMGKVTEACRSTALADFGIEVVDVRLRRMNFPKQNLRSVYNRMKAERERIAKKYLAEGEEKASEIRADTDKEVRGLLAEAYRDAQVKKGEGEAEAIRIYAAAFNRDPEFYKLTRTLEAYRKFMDNETTLILNADSPLFEYLQHPPGNGGR